MNCRGKGGGGGGGRARGGCQGSLDGGKALKHGGASRLRGRRWGTRLRTWQACMHLLQHRMVQDESSPSPWICPAHLPSTISLTTSPSASSPPTSLASVPLPSATPPHHPPPRLGGLHRWAATQPVLRKPRSGQTPPLSSPEGGGVGETQQESPCRSGGRCAGASQADVLSGCWTSPRSASTHPPQHRAVSNRRPDYGA